MKRLLTLSLLLFAGSAFASGSSVTWVSSSYGQSGKRVWEHKATIVSDNAAGTASGAWGMQGYVVRVVTQPDGGGTAPSTNWGCTLVGDHAEDVLGGAISANRSATLTQNAYPLDQNSSGAFAYVHGSPTLTCAAMGNSKGAVVTVYVQE